MPEKSKKVIAVLPDSAFGAIEILAIDCDRVTARYNYGKPEKERRFKLNYNERKGSYFRMDNRRLYLDDFLRVAR